MKFFVVMFGMSGGNGAGYNVALRIRTSLFSVSVSGSFVFCRVSSGNGRLSEKRN